MDKLLFLTRFSRLAQWDVKHFLKIKVNSKYPVEKLGKHLVHQTSKIQLSNFGTTKVGILGVSNKLGMFDADYLEGNKISQKYHTVKENWLAYNPYRINVGSIGWRTKQQTGKYISPAYVVFSCKKTLLPEYMYLLAKSKKFNVLIRNATTGTVRQTLHFENLAGISAPVPPISVQRKILDEYHKLIKKADVFQQDVVKIIAETEDFVYNALNINKLNLEVKDEASMLRFCKFSKLAKWDVARRNTTLVPSELFYSRTFKNKLLSDVCKINPTTSLSKFGKQEVTFLPMECVSAEDGEISAPKIGVADKSNGYTKFQEGDVLWAKITPCMQNGKCAVARNLINKVGYGSTEFNVFRANVDEIVPDYLHALLRMKNLRILAQEYFTGSSGQQRVSAEFFEELTIPVPNIQKQKEIIKHIANQKQEIKNKAEFAAACRQQATEYFEKAVFIE